MLGALCSGQTNIEGFSFCEDCRSTLRCLRSFGAEIKEEPVTHQVEVHSPGHRHLQEPDTVLDVGNSGTTIRMLSGIACGIEGLTVLTGDASIRKRPMKRIIDPLTATGALLGGRNHDRYPPLYVRGRRRLRAISYQMEVASAQVKSALLFASLFADDRSVIEELLPTRNHTENMLRYLGVSVVEQEKRLYLTPPDRMPATRFSLPGDPSSAAFPAALALLIPESSITIRNVGLNPLRTGFLECLRLMGADLTIIPQGECFSEGYGDIQIQHAPLQGIAIPREMIPSLVDEIPILAVLATQAQGVTSISGAGELRVKESDRLHGIARGLQLMGADITEEEDGLRITGPVKLRGAAVSSGKDHRIAMSLLVAGLAAEGETIVQESECIGVSYPEFFHDLALLGVQTFQPHGVQS